MAEGKDAVIKYLEHRTGDHAADAKSSPIYDLVRDDNGVLVLWIAGSTFVGNGAITLAGKLVHFEDGCFTEIDDKP